MGKSASTKKDSKSEYASCEVFWHVTTKAKCPDGRNRRVTLIAKARLTFQRAKPRGGFTVSMHDAGNKLTNEKAFYLSWDNAVSFVHQCFEIRAEPDMSAEVNKALNDVAHTSPEDKGARRGR